MMNIDELQMDNHDQNLRTIDRWKMTDFAQVDGQWCFLWKMSDELRITLIMNNELCDGQWWEIQDVCSSWRGRIRMVDRMRRSMGAFHATGDMDRQMHRWNGCTQNSTPSCDPSAAEFLSEKWIFIRTHYQVWRPYGGTTNNHMVFDECFVWSLTSFWVFRWRLTFLYALADGAADQSYGRSPSMNQAQNVEQENLQVVGC